MAMFDYCRAILGQDQGPAVALVRHILLHMSVRLESVLIWEWQADAYEVRMTFSSSK